MTSAPGWKNVLVLGSPESQERKRRWLCSWRRSTCRACGRRRTPTGSRSTRAEACRSRSRCGHPSSCHRSCTSVAGSNLSRPVLLYQNRIYCIKMNILHQTVLTASKPDLLHQPSLIISKTVLLHQCYYTYSFLSVFSSFEPSLSQYDRKNRAVGIRTCLTQMTVTFEAMDRSVIQPLCLFCSLLPK